MRNFLISSVVSLFFLIPMTSMAGNGVVDADNDAITVDCEPSKNVTIVYNTSDASFAAIASHLQGDALYGSGSDSPLVYKNETAKDKGTQYTTDVGSDNATTAFAGDNWSSI